MPPAKTPPAGPPKGQREADQIRQIAHGQGAKFISQTSGSGRYMITLTRFGIDPDDKQFRAALHAIESVVRGQFDRGQRFQGLTQFTLKSNLIDVVVRCMA